MTLRINPRGAILLTVLATACGGDAKHKSAKGDDAPETEAPAPPRTFSEAELMHLAGATEGASATGQSVCADVLAKGVYNTSKSTLSDVARESLKRSYCAIGETSLAEKIRDFYSRDSAASTSNSVGGGASIGIPGVGELAGEGWRSGSDATHEAMTEEQAREIARQWFALNCESNASSTTQDFVHAVQSESVDPMLIEAWRECVTRAQAGLFCSSRADGDLVVVDVAWSPSDLQRLLLPRLELTWVSHANLTLAASEAPSTLGTGTGLSVGFIRKDPKLSGSVQLYGHDPGHQVNFNCSLVVPSRIKGVVKEDPRCGIAENATRRDSVCGVEAYNEGRGAKCGVELYTQRASAACGAARYAEGEGPACGGAGSEDHDITILEEPVSFGGAQIEKQRAQLLAALDARRASGELDRRCRSDWHPESKVVRRKLEQRDGRFLGTATCRRDTWARCADKSFGVAAWKTCRDPSHGVERYAACRHESFGVERYKECRHPSFGAGRYESCFVYEER